MSTPIQRSTAAQVAADTRWARETDRVSATQPARRGLRAKYAREVDPDGTLPLDEVERRVDSAMKAHMGRMRLAKTRKASERAA